MKYCAPDYERVQIRVENIFASYSTCVEKSYWEWTYTVPCEGSSDYQYVQKTMTSLGFGSQCFENNLG